VLRLKRNQKNFTAKNTKHINQIIFQTIEATKQNLRNKKRPT
jgi:hypothetical protein